MSRRGNGAAGFGLKLLALGVAAGTVGFVGHKALPHLGEGSNPSLSGPVSPGASEGGSPKPSGSEGTRNRGTGTPGTSPESSVLKTVCPNGASTIEHVNTKDPKAISKDGTEAVFPTGLTAERGTTFRNGSANWTLTDPKTRPSYIGTVTVDINGNGSTEIFGFNGKVIDVHVKDGFYGCEGNFSSGSKERR